jgi:hypothetical protein
MLSLFMMVDAFGCLGLSCFSSFQLAQKFQLAKDLQDGAAL